MSQEQKSALGANVISLPKGGGAVAGMGESFSPDLFTGTGNFSVPIAVPPGRNGLQPSLTLGYSTGSGNGPFGLGWNMGLPGVSRKTNLGIPRYDDTKDVFVLSGAEDLIPVDRGSSAALGITHRWIQYRPRTEGLFARIMHHTFSDGQSFDSAQDYWEVRTKDGMVTWYGKPGAQAVDNTVVYDPENPRHIASWLIHRTVDPFGNEVVYEYERDIALTPYPFAQLYLKRIKYADYKHGSATKYLCSVEVNYADRLDAHSEYRQGFEIRTRKRATEVNTYTHPLDVDLPPGYLPSGTNTNSILVKQYKLTYRDELGYTAKNKVSQLAQVQAFGFSAPLEGTELVVESLPPVEFEYTDFDISKRDLRVLSDDHLPALGLGHPDMDLVDLDGNGLPDFVQMSAGQAIRYWRNKGGGVFDMPRTMKNAPTGLSLGNGAVQLMDADGDGRVDLVMNAPNFAGYYSLNHDGEWDVNSFRKYRTRPPINLKSAQAQFMDLSGDGRTDVLINSNRFECYFQNSPLLASPPGLTPNPSPVERGLVDENRAIGWSEARFVNKGNDLDDFPNVNFGDPRIRTADLSGDGLQDIVMIQNGNIAYWPNLGYGRFGKRRIMRNSPRLGYDFNPAQLLLGDADGDGQTDVIYVERNQITIWFNQSGNAFSEPVVIKGTPSYTNRDSIRMVDLFGTGTPGILWSYDLGAAGVRQGTRIAYLDLSGGIKPYVMVGMRNNLGARTRVQYGSSVRHYLRDTYGPHSPGLTPALSSLTPALSPGSSPGQAGEGGDVASDFVGYAGKWKTTLPFPVQVVDRVEVIDEISKGKLTTRYFYHHGYWDGGEREFRGFGRVDQFDTETFDRFNGDNLVLEADPLNSSAPLGVSVEHYAPPVLAKNWFHLGPVGAERGDWKEVDFANEYWAGDTNMLQRDPAMLQMIAGLPRRARRDAFRTLRGTALRSELYSMDPGSGSGAGSAYLRPYTVSETQTGLRLVASPSTNATIEALRVETHSNHIFFSYGLSSRSTTWERGTDPMTKFSFTGAIDDYGQPLSQISVAVPRGKDPRTGGQLQNHSGVYDASRGYDATIQFTEYIYKDEGGPGSGAGMTYIVNRAKQARSYEAIHSSSLTVFALRDILLEGTSVTLRLLGLSYTYYDGPAYDGLDYGEIGAYGVPVRTETLMVQPSDLDAVYGNAPGAHPPPFNSGVLPIWSSFSPALVSALQDLRCGYVWHSGGVEDFVPGYYTSAQRTKFDYQGDSGTAKGLPVAMRDVFDNEASIEYDSYLLLPVKVTDPLGMETSAEYDYRILQPDRVTDANQNVSTFAFTPLGLMYKTALLGKDASTGLAQANEGDTLTDPGVLLEYDLFAFKDRGEPVWVKTTQREHHINAPYGGGMIPGDFNATIVAVEYSDGFGRQLQTRTQAEDIIFGNALSGDSGLPAVQSAPNAPAVGNLRPPPAPLNVVVSGAKLYNNKGKVVEQWEPYFSQGFGLTDPTVQHGQRVRIYFDALGRPQRTVNPDDTEQRVVYGVPNMLNTPGAFAPSPWERFTYDANDLAPLTHPGNTLSASHHWTPKSELIDALGRTVRTVEYITALPTPGSGAPDIRTDDVVMKYAYDVKGQLLEVTDPLDRVCFAHKYDTAGNNLWTEHRDSGVRKVIVDAQGKPLYGDDAKGARVFTSYDQLSRPTGVWARNKSMELLTRRQWLIYGDQAGLGDTIERNLMGRLYQHYDEAGKVQLGGYDFKGNPLEKTRWVIRDDQAQPLFVHVVDWTPLDESILDLKTYTTTLSYDALNRVREAMYPEDVNGDRAVSNPRYNRAGALQSIWQDGLPYVWEIAYNAKGQRLLLSMANDVMTRYTYDQLNFRLLRIRSEKFTRSGLSTLDPDGGVQQDLAYQYDLGGNILGIRDKAPANGSTQGPGDLLKQFEYDPLKRLLTATGRESTAPASYPTWDAGIRAHDHTATNTYTRAYDYDKVGNVLQEQHTADGNPSGSYTKLFHYHATGAHNRLESYEMGGLTFPLTYDANGNQLKETTSRYHKWDHSDQLKYFMVQAGSSSSPPSVWAHYFYAGGTRLKKVVSKIVGGSIIQEVTVYIDGVFEETYVRTVGGGIDPNKHYNTIHVMDGRSRIATIRVGNDVDDPTPATKFNLEDHLGTSSVTLNFGGDLINREEYYPFGETCFGAFAKKRYRYVGKEKDNESGLYYYGARYYAAWTCRFISVDPLAHDYPYLTPYNYAGNKPIGDLDIDGMQSTGDKPHTDPRVREGGQNIKDGDRANADVLYEAMQLPDSAVHGQTETFHYTTGDQTCVDWVYDQEKDSWSMTVDFRDGTTGAVDDLFGGRRSDRNPDNLDMAPSEKTSEKGAGGKGKSSAHKAASTTSQGKEQLAPTEATSPVKVEHGPSGGASTQPSEGTRSSTTGSPEEKSVWGIVWSTVKFAAKTARTVADETVKNEPHYASSNPLDSPENVAKANSQLGKISSWAKKIAKRMGFVDKVESIVTALYNIFAKGVIIASQIVDVVWNLLSAAGPIGYLMDFGKWVASVSGAKDWLYREIDELIPAYHWR